MKRVRGFTLIELLVVVAIIGLLLSILMPSLRRARDQAKQVKCQASLRQIGVAFEAYASNHRSWYPSWSAWHVWGFFGTEADGTNGDSEGPAWTERLKDDGSLPSIEIYTCPSFPTHLPITYFQTAYAAWGRHQRRSTLQSWVRHPSAFVMSGDCTNPFFYVPPFGNNPVEARDDADMDNASFPCLDWSNTIHREKNNVLFADGHVTAYSEFKKTEMTLDTQDRGVAWGELAEPEQPSATP